MASRRELERRYRRAYAKEHGRVLTLINNGDRALHELYSEAARDLEERLSHMRGKSGAMEATRMRAVRSELDDIMSDIRRNTNRIIEKNTLRAVALGIDVPGRAITSVIGTRGAQIANGLPDISIVVPISPKSKQWANLNRRTFEYLKTNPLDEVGLSTRIWRDTENTKGQILRLVRSGVVRGAPNQTVAMEARNLLLKPDGLAVQQAGQMKRFRTLAGKARDAQNFDKAAEYFRKANAIEAGIPRPGTGVYRSAVKNSQRVSRTELNNAFHEGTKAYHRTKPWIIGDKWNLSSGHTIVDICDEYARTDYHGLGAGIFPPGESPRIPHPHCLCFITSVLDWAYLGMTNPELQAAA